MDWIIKELDSFSTRTSSRFLLSEENKTVLRELLPKWQGRTTKDRALSIIPEAAKEAMASQAFLLSPLSSGLGHISVSYQKLIDHGIDFLLDEIREKLAHCQPTAAEDVERKVFYEACQIVLQAMLHFAERFAALAETQAARPKASGRTSCSRSPCLPARSPANAPRPSMRHCRASGSCTFACRSTPTATA